MEGNSGAIAKAEEAQAMEEKGEIGIRITVDAVEERAPAEEDEASQMEGKRYGNCKRRWSPMMNLGDD